MTPCRVLVCGSADYARPEMVRFALDRLKYRKGDLIVYDLGGATGADAGARWHRMARGWPGETVWRQTVFDDVKPDYVLCFGEDERSVVSKARSLGVTVGEVK